MPYQMSWYHQDHIVYAAVSGNFTVAEFEAYGQELIDQYFDKASHPVHVISDVSQMKKFPTQVWTAIRTTEPWLRHRNLGHIILLSGGSHSMLRYLLSAVSQVVPVRYHMVATPAEGFMLLQQLDPLLASSVDEQEPLSAAGD